MKSLQLTLLGLSFASLTGTAAAAQPMVYEGTAGGVRYIEQGQPAVIIHATVDAQRLMNGAGSKGNHGKSPFGGSKTNNLIYQGGLGGIGVETAPQVYVVFWGSQWVTNGDPSGEATILQDFFSAVGGSSWLNSVTQYCQGQGISSSTDCSSNFAGNQTDMLVDFWYDTEFRAPSRPKQSDLAAEAVHAAEEHWGITDNDNAQIVIATATGNNASGFGTQYCAWHSYTTSSSGNIAYTNLPYITDAGASCGANFNGLGANAGITIVEGHEMAETITDQFPSGGWLDANGQENGDKCAWISSGQGATADESLNGTTFPVQSLWSNAYNKGSGGCVMNY